ncbi:MAG: phosphatase [Actinomycetota bacterium]|nr:phosphatase [Actinomycetota bacterium]
MSEPGAAVAARLAEHLVESRLAGSVATPVKSCLDNSRRMIAGEPDYTFGLSDWRHATYDDALAALLGCGVALVDPDGRAEDPAVTPVVDPSFALAAIHHHRTVLSQVAVARGRVLFGTGHAFSLLPHYSGLARALAGAGCTILEPLNGQHHAVRTPEGDPASIRYFDGVASLVSHGALLHTHRPDYMEAMLAELGGPGSVDLVVGDHGFAGAAVERGIQTLSIADVNDPALPLAQARRRTDGVLVIDDGLNPVIYEPLTAVMLDGFSVDGTGTKDG